MTPAWPAPPRWLVALSGVVVALGAAVCVVGALRIGVTVDETFHVVRLENYLQHGWYLLDDDLGPDGPGAWVGDAYVYAPVTTLLLHLANVVLGQEAWSTVAVTPGAYAVRHLGVAAFGAVGVAATAGIATVVSGSRRWGIVAAGMLSALPMWWGHAMFNVKDVPVGAGFALVTLGCLLSMRDCLRAADGPVRRRPGLALGAVGVGVLVAIGTRPAMWVALGPVVAWTLLVVLRAPGGSRAGRRRTALGLVVASLVPLLLLAGIYPHVFAHPQQWVLGSVFDSSSNQMVSYRGHLPYAIATTVPIVLLVIGLLGAYGRLAAWRTDRRLLTGTAPFVVVLLLQTLLMPVMLVVTSAAVSGGLRHVLFAAPSAAVLMAAGLAQLLGDAGARGRTVLSALAGVGMVLPAITQVQLFPYSYAYGNEVVAAAGLPSPADFWQASFREYADDLTDGDFVVCGANADAEGRPLRQIPNGGQSWLDLSQECTSGPQGVLTPYASGRHPTDEVRGDFVALSVRVDTATEGCRPLAEVTRRRLLWPVVLSVAETCPLVLLPYEGPVDLDGAGRGSGYLLGGWTGNGGATAITAQGRASLGFDLGPEGDAPEGTLTFVVSGDAEGAVDFLVDDVPADVDATADGWRVSAAAADLRGPGGPGNVVLTVLAEDGPVHVSRVAIEEEAS